jgi:hypothetical protein
MKFKIPYYIENCGDGSVALRICESFDEAHACDISGADEGFSEETADEIEVEFDKGKLNIIRNGRVAQSYEQYIC